MSDVRLIERLLGVGFFHYGPRLWMVGEIEPLKALERVRTRQSIVNRILAEYPARVLHPREHFYRVRIDPSNPSDAAQYDSAPPEHAGRGRLDLKGKPVLYGSPDLEVCIHECRVSAEDDTFVATLQAKRELSAEERDVLRAEITRHRLQSIEGPSNISRLQTPNPTETSNPEQNDE